MKFVPQILTNVQKQQGVNVCHELWEKAKEDPTSLIFFSEEHAEMVSHKGTGIQNATVLVAFTCEIQQSLFVLS